MQNIASLATVSAEMFCKVYQKNIYVLKKMLTNPVVCKHFSYMSVGVFVAVVKRSENVQTLLNARSIGKTLAKVTV